MALVVPWAAEPLESAERFQIDIGGAESNVSSHLARAGVTSAWASAVGDDALGRRVLTTLRGRGVDTSWVRVDPTAPTGVYFKDPAPGGSRVSYYRAGSAASLLGADFALTLPLHGAKLVHCSGITPALSRTCAELVDRVLGIREAASLPVSFDVNYRAALWPSVTIAAPALLALARRADIVFVGRDEAEALWGTSTPDEIRELLPDCAELVVKDADIDAQVFTTSGVERVAPEPVSVVEPVRGRRCVRGWLPSPPCSPATRRTGASVTATFSPPACCFQPTDFEAEPT